MEKASRNYKENLFDDPIVNFYAVGLEYDVDELEQFEEAKATIAEIEHSSSFKAVWDGAHTLKKRSELLDCVKKHYGDLPSDGMMKYTVFSLFPDILDNIDSYINSIKAGEAVIFQAEKFRAQTSVRDPGTKIGSLGLSVRA